MHVSIIKKFTKKEKYLIFSGIGNPESFKKTLVNNNFNIIKMLYFLIIINITNKYK